MAKYRLKPPSERKQPEGTITPEDVAGGTDTGKTPKEFERWTKETQETYPGGGTPADWVRSSGGTGSFATGGGGGGRAEEEETPTGIESSQEAERQAAAEAARREAERLEAEAARARGEQRRANLLRASYRKEALARSIEKGISIEAAGKQLNVERVKELKEQRRIQEEGRGRVSVGGKATFEKDASGKIERVSYPTRFGIQTLEPTYHQELLTVEKAEEPTQLEKFEREARTKAERGKATIPERAGLFALSFAKPIVTFPERIYGFGKSLVTQPVTTVKSVPQGIRQTGERLITELEGPTPETAIGEIGGELTLWKGLGKVSDLPPLKRARFRKAEIQQAGKVKVSLIKKGVTTPKSATQIEESLKSAIRLQEPLRGVPDVPIKKPITEIIPKDLTKPQKEVFAKTLFEPEVEIFGGQALALRDIRKSGDIDIAIPQNIEKVTETAGLLREVSPRGTKIMKTKESVGIGAEKAFDIKPVERLREFPLKQRPVTTKEGVRVTRTSEQFERALAGTLELRKGGKDIKDVILSGRGLVRESSIKAQATRLPGLRQFRQLRARKLEKRLLKVEKGFPEIARVTSKIDPEHTPEIPRRIGLVTRDVDIPQIIPKGKRGSVTLPSVKGDTIIRKPGDRIPMIEAEPLKIKKTQRPKELDSSKIVGKIKPVKPSKIPRVALESSRIKPLETLKPSRVPTTIRKSKTKIIPSQIPKFYTKIKPSKIIPSRIGKSTLTPSTIPSSSIPGISLPEIPIETRLFKPTKKKKKKKPTKKRKIREDIGIQEGFIARQLGLEPQFFTEPQVRKIAQEPLRPAGLRPAPLKVR